VATSLKATWKKLAESRAPCGVGASKNMDSVNRMVFLVTKQLNEEHRRATAEGGMKPH
jgi:hypothetical protein